MSSPFQYRNQLGLLTERYEQPRDDRMSCGAGASQSVARSFLGAGWPTGSRNEDSLAGTAESTSTVDLLGNLFSDIPIANYESSRSFPSSSFYPDRHRTDLASHIPVGQQRVGQCAPFTPSNDIFNAYSGPNDTGVPGVEYDIFHQGANYVCPPDNPCRSPTLGLYQDPGIDVSTVLGAITPPQMTIAHAQAQRVLSPVISATPSMTRYGRPPFGGLTRSLLLFSL
ncbi:hypothetical protein BKA93DRAFT_826758 [Sparassis latifolia]